MKLKYRLIVGIIAISTIVLSLPDLTNTYIFGIEPAAAQSMASSDAWRQVYQRLPEFPLENKYITKKTRKVSENQTLARRLIRYHIYLKGRSPNSRLDWKLTLADYLGANEIIYDSSYPGSDTLSKNPLDGDRAAIASLNRAQRNQLIQVLISIFNQK
ncbi:hypothetical protein [Rivularia sp. UHCC 0363]|uniref:hypothetical protein n=1 Tax=Rivularia sp. UHCC 0363 TaxID=3110244 RepID=UPI002B209D2B|nr:hypothetical protein [Rivularia sp. UHCC 0363]MEA5592775.1 hypothetical protein [Rivularia sp. UHCC 0363]